MRTLTRREFLLTSSAAAAAAACGRADPDPAAETSESATATARAGAPRGSAGREPDPDDAGKTGVLRRIGLQLYTVRTLMGQDMEGTLAGVAAIGYDEVEFAGYFGRSPDEVRDALARAGLRAPSAHVAFEAIEADWERTLDDARRTGHHYVVVPWIPDGYRTLDGYRRVADLFNRAGERARGVGLRFAYHNHSFEFEPIEDQVPYDLLVTRTERELVAHEMDLYWVRKGGGDPLDYIARFPGRFELVHVKDMGEGEDRPMVDVGDGIIDFRAIFARAAHAGIRHAFVEHDDPADPIETIRKSYVHMTRLEV